MNFKYTDDEITAAVQKQRQPFMEAAAKFSKSKKSEEPPTDEEMKPVKETKHFRKFKVGEDRVDVDIKHGSIYINDQLITENTDIPKKVIHLLQKVIPKLAGGKEA